MTGPRIPTVHPHRSRARRLLPFLTVILLSPLACTESTAPEPATPVVSAEKTRLHPYLVSKDGQTAAPSFLRTGTSSMLVTLGSAGTSGSASVLLLADEDGASTTALANSIASAGFLVTVRPAPEYTWDATNPSLDGFDLVIHLNGNTFLSGQALSAGAQTALLDFVRAGGGYVGAQWNSYEATDQQGVMQDLVLAGFPGSVEENCAPCPITYSIVTEQQGHALIEGIPSSFTFEADGHLGGPQVDFGTDPSTVVMRLPSGTPGVLVRSLGGGKVVNFSFAPNYSLGGEGQTLRDPNIQQLYVNAVRWAARASTQPSKAPATITLVDPVATFDGTAKSVSVVTDPVGLTGVTVTYSLAGVPVSAPVNAGVYQVLATLDHEDYQAPQATGTLTIRQATPVIHWAPPPAITTGTPLGDNELNASVTGVGGTTVAGELVYLPAAGTILDAGTQPLSVEFLSWDGNYTNAIKTVLILVSQPASGLTFKGFYLPVRNLPFRNRVRPGRAVPVRFSVSGNQGGTALQAGSPSSMSVPCESGMPERMLEQTNEPRASALEFTARTGEYRYDWKTSPAWAGTCRKLVVTLVDGSTHEAVFRFAKKSKRK